MGFSVTWASRSVTRFIFSVDTLLLLFDTVCLYFSLANDFVMHLLEVLTNVEV